MYLIVRWHNKSFSAAKTTYFPPLLLCKKSLNVALKIVIVFSVFWPRYILSPLTVSPIIPCCWHLNIPRSWCCSGLLALFQKQAGRHLSARRLDICSFFPVERMPSGESIKADGGGASLLAHLAEGPGVTKVPAVSGEYFSLFSKGCGINLASVDMINWLGRKALL